MWFLYVLVDPTDGACRYVGKTRDAVQRYQQHLNAKGRSRRASWVRGLVKRNLCPSLRVLAIVETEDEVVRLEIALIAAWRQRGVQLTNMTDGGDGIGGFHHRPSTKAKIVASNRAVWTPERRAAWSQRCSEMARQPERLAQLAAAHRGKQFDASAKAKMRAAKVGRTLSESHKAKIGAAHADRQFSPEHRAHLQAAAAARQARGPWHSDATKQKISATLLH